MTQVGSASLSMDNDGKLLLHFMPSHCWAPTARRIRVGIRSSMNGTEDAPQKAKSDQRHTLFKLQPTTPIFWSLLLCYCCHSGFVAAERNRRMSKGLSHLIMLSSGLLSISIPLDNGPPVSPFIVLLICPVIRRSGRLLLLLLPR